MSRSHEVSALVLSGGGAYGAYEVGVMMALLQGDSPAQGGVPLNPRIFAGTSSGGINAAWMTSQPGGSLTDTAADLKTLWLDDITSHCGGGAVRYRANPLEFLNPACYATHPTAPFRHLAEDASFFLQDFSRRALNFSRAQGTLSRRVLELIDVSSIISVEPLRELLRRRFSFSGMRESQRGLLIGATNWATGSLKLFRNQDMGDETGVEILMAASAFPGLDPVYIADEPYVDGGYVMDTPLLPAINAGADTLHVVYLDPDTSKIPVQRLQNTIDMLDRMFLILRASIYNRDIQNAEDVNEGIALLEGSITDELSPKQTKSVIRSLSQISNGLKTGKPYRKVRIHRYHPSDDLGGVIGLLNFERDQIAHLIDRGFQDAASHNCEASGCILPALSGNERSEL